MSTLYVDNLQPNLGSRVMAAGHVVQMQHNTSYTSTQSTTASTWFDVSPSITITPTSTSSKIYITHKAPVMCYQTSGNVFIRLLRDGTEILQFGRFYQDIAASDWSSFTVAPDWVDEPNTTSAVTYSFQMYWDGANGQLRHNNNTGSFTPQCISTAWEIAQ